MNITSQPALWSRDAWPHRPTPARSRAQPAYRGTAGKLSRVLDELAVAHDIKEYPDAGHAFLNDHETAGDKTPLIFAVMGIFSGPADYHQPSAKDARRRIIAFFRTHLAA